MSQSETDTARIRLFKYDWLERLTTITPVGFCLTWAAALPLIAFSGWGTVGPFAGVGLFLTGAVVWFFFEYAMHRYLFHWRLDWRPVQTFVFLMHGNHHADPDDRLRNLMPPIASFPIASVVWLTFLALAGHAGTWIFLGFISGYVCYDLIHFACHQRKMRGRIGRALKRHHVRHHHSERGGNYSITTIFLDRLFGSEINSLKRSH